MSKREENLRRLANFGIQLESEESLPDPAPTNEPSPENPAPEPEPEPTPASEPPKDKSPDGHDWDKRKADAQEAQRQLSKRERALDEKERQIDQKLAELTAKMSDFERLVATKESPTSKQPEPESEFDRDYPELASEVSRKAEAKAREILREEREREAKERSEREQEEAKKKSKADLILQEVFEARPDAAEVAQSKEFNEWLDTLPARVGTKYRDYIERTTLYSAQDALDVLDLFDAYKKSSKPSRPTPEASVQIPPAGQSVRQTSTTEIRALTTQEMTEINSLIRNARTQAERDLWTKRLHYTFRNDSER